VLLEPDSSDGRSPVAAPLSAINKGDVLAAGHLATAPAVKMPLNFVVPLVVSNLGPLAAESRTVTRRGPRS
jgi:hypothetical protein